MKMLKFILLLGSAVLALEDGKISKINKLFLDFDDISTNFEKLAKEVLKSVNSLLIEIANHEMKAIWNYQSNLKDPSMAEARTEVFKKTSPLKKTLIEHINKIQFNSIKDNNTKRQFSKMGDIGIAALSPEHLNEYQTVMTEMVTKFSTATVCEIENQKKCDLRLEPDLTKLMATNRNATVLAYYWAEWRNATGKKMKNLYPKYVSLVNEAAKLNGFEDKSEVWMQKYEVDDFQEQIEAVWQEIKPLYQEMHAYVRRKLREKYGESVVSKDQPIPAHLLGTMWADSWENIANFTTPYPGKQLPDVTPTMVKQNYTAMKIFKLAEASFLSMNMSAMPELFWNKSIFEKPTDREVVCEPSAWDFYNGKDFRIRMCTSINANSLQRAHHEMGHIQYYMAYKNQPVVFRQGANPGFQEAIGDMISLSTTTPKHLQKIGLLDNYVIDDEASLNHLYLKGLELITNLPFAYIMDLYRWKIFQGKITPDNYNCEWWKLVEEFQGIEPPVDRTEEDFDYASKFHVVNDVEYIRYFVSNVIQFQFHEALCIVAGEFRPHSQTSKPLHHCDITNSKEAGNLLKKMLKMGSSKPWPDAMEVLTGQRNMSSSGILDYFRPLKVWLETENKKSNEYIGWKKSTKKCVDTRNDLH